ncbi:cation/H(+) antiporter 15-like [Salvia miltiorrhiza]|uniref:cation/H(+) antiporter 15-like n=1 Tax=Salvia miltiorrhiza TaxID=226208 RepID=UPI0025AD236D|nr:cation/H(+) antiporter 15-like [Salvia miltiorrhiza]
MAAIPGIMDIAKLNQTILCYAETIYRFNGLWEGPDPLTPLISLFLIQLTFSMGVIHLLVFALKPSNQPPFIAEVLGGILLGPTVFGRIAAYRKLAFPNYSFRILEPMAHLSITYYAFLVGLKMDVKGIMRTGPKAMKVALAGIIIPFSIGAGLYFIFQIDKPERAGCLFWGAALTVTGFSVLTDILDKQQMLHTESGKTALSSALINEMCSWGFLALGFAVTSSQSSIQWSVMSTAAFALVCVYFVRPGLSWLIHRAPEGQGYSEFYICSIVSGMALSGVITDACGTHPMIGAFVFGLIIPNEVLEVTIVDKLEDFVMGILMPVYFVVCGLRTNVDTMSYETSWAIVLLVIILACGVKVLSALAVTALSDLSVEEAVPVGFMCNAKSVMALIIIESGQIQGALSTQTYSVMMVAILVMSMITTPAAIWFKPVQNVVPYKRRTVQKAKSDEELRVLACIHSTRNVPSIIHLLRTSNAKSRSPMSVFALQLVELVGRASTMMVVHSSRKAGPRNPNSVELQADQIITAFDNYELRSEGVVTQVITARCPYTTMDEDVCAVARDRRAAFLVIPFHKHRNVEGEMEDINPSIRSINEGVLENAPCSVGILIDRGAAESQDHAQNIAALFFGGPDDREALAYAWRMADETDSRLTVVRFIPSSEAGGSSGMMIEKSHVSLEIDREREKLLDDDYYNKFRNATANSGNIRCFDLVLDDEEETIKAIKSMDEHYHDLYIVGRGRGMQSPLTTGLADWCDCPELGPIGDLLVTSEFESTFSVLIVQQHSETGRSREGSYRSALSVDYGAGDEITVRDSAPTESETFESFGSFRKWDHEN